MHLIARCLGCVAVTLQSLLLFSLRSNVAVVLLLRCNRTETSLSPSLLFLTKAPAASRQFDPLTLIPGPSLEVIYLRRPWPHLPSLPKERVHIFDRKEDDIISMSARLHQKPPLLRCVAVEGRLLVYYWIAFYLIYLISCWIVNQTYKVPCNSQGRGPGAGRHLALAHALCNPSF